jgi:agmatinase
MDCPCPNFLGLKDELAQYETAAAVILPVPFERTTSFGKGTAGGPSALLHASSYVELYDEELNSEPSDQGIATLPAFSPPAENLGEALEQIANEARRHLEAGKFLVTIGGEHSLTPAVVRAASDLYPDLAVVQFDAHADLRESYEGNYHSHASVMYRVVKDFGLPTLAVGIRSLSSPEARLLREQDLPVIWGHQLEDAEERFSALLETLPDTIYLTFDIDFFDPSLVPSTGTPEPGGGFWTPTMRLLRQLFERKRVLAMDVVELAPTVDHPASDFVAAKLVYKCLGYRRIHQSHSLSASITVG